LMSMRGQPSSRKMRTWSASSGSVKIRVRVRTLVISSLLNSGRIISMLLSMTRSMAARNCSM
jgi:hypothetical protein